MKTVNVTLLSEIKSDKHINQAKKILSQVGELFKCRINIKAQSEESMNKGSISSFQEIIKSCQESDAAILSIQESDNNKDAELRNELGIVTRYSEGQTCAIFEPVLRDEAEEDADRKNAKAYINSLALLFDHLKVSEASILLQKAYAEILKGKDNLNDYADQVVNYVKDRLNSQKKKETENYGEILLSWGGVGEI